MSEDKEKSGEAFLSRWSRLKQEAGNAPPAERQPAPPEADPKAPPPELPPLDKLTADSDFRGFFHPEVDENLRQAALKKLFADPHFNVMDGLDVYIDDYSRPDPLPAAMLAQLKHAQKIIDWAREGAEDSKTKIAGLPDETPALPPADQVALPAAAAVQPLVDQPQDTEQRIEPQTTDTRKP